MRALALALAFVLLPGVASAAGSSFVRGAQGPFSPRPRVRLPLNVLGCYTAANIRETHGITVSFSRASSAIYTNAGGTEFTCASGELRVGADPSTGFVGALIEESATNYVLNSGTHPKTTESTASIPGTGPRVAWHAGTGTMTLVAGTATVTGLSCTAVSAGTECPFTVTVAGTMVITTTAGTTHAQVERSARPTSKITTTGTAASRSGDVMSVPNPVGGLGMLDRPFCYKATAQPFLNRAYPAHTTFAADGTSAPRPLGGFAVYSGMSFEVSSSTPGATPPSGAVVAYGTSPLPYRHTVYSNAAPAQGSHRFAYGWSPGTLFNTYYAWPNVRVDGVLVAQTLDTPLGGMSSTWSTPLYIGNSAGVGGPGFSGYLRDVEFWTVDCGMAR